MERIVIDKEYLQAYLARRFTRPLTPYGSHFWVVGRWMVPRAKVS